MNQSLRTSRIKHSFKTSVISIWTSKVWCLFWKDSVWKEWWMKLIESLTPILRKKYNVIIHGHCRSEDVPKRIICARREVLQEERMLWVIFCILWRFIPLVKGFNKEVMVDELNNVILKWVYKLSSEQKLSFKLSSFVLFLWF